MSEPDKPLDEALGALYRGLPRDEPPAAIDAAVLEAARRSVERPSRKWGAPVALAAVLVLSVGLSLRVAEEKPDAQMQPAAPMPSAAAPSPVAPQATDSMAKPTEVPPEARPRKPQPAAPRQDMARGPAREERAAQAPPAEAAAANAPQAQSPAFVPDPRADSARAAPPAAPSALGSASAPASAAAERPAARSAMRAAPSAVQDAAPPSLAKSTAESSLTAAAQSPEVWLERIVEMRAQGRHKEADEGLTEFRRRYPGFVISPETLRKIEPPR